MGTLLRVCAETGDMLELDASIIFPRRWVAVRLMNDLTSNEDGLSLHKDLSLMRCRGWQNIYFHQTRKEL